MPEGEEVQRDPQADQGGQPQLLLPPGQRSQVHRVETDLIPTQLFVRLIG